MRVVLQAVLEAAVHIENQEVAKIDRGFLLFVGFTTGDTLKTMKKMINKIVSLRLFKDQNDKTNLSLEEVGGQILCVSQFTLYADVKKGRRPSFTKSLEAEAAKRLYEQTLDYLKTFDLKLQAGVFQADMKVHLINDGPFTLMLDSEDL